MRYLAARLLTQSIRRALRRRNEPTPFVPKETPVPKARLQLEPMETREAPGNLLGGLLVAAFGVTMLDPIFSMASATGELSMLPALSSSREDESAYLPSDASSAPQPKDDPLPLPPAAQPVPLDVCESIPAFGSENGDELSLKTGSIWLDPFGMSGDFATDGQPLVPMSAPRSAGSSSASTAATNAPATGPISSATGAQSNSIGSSATLPASVNL